MQLHIKFERPNSLVAQATIQSTAILFMPKRRPSSAAANFQKKSSFLEQVLKGTTKTASDGSGGRRAPRNLEKCVKLMDVRAPGQLTTRSFLSD